MESDMGSEEANLFYSFGACFEQCASKPRYNSILAPLRLWCELPQLYTKRSHCRKALTDSAIAFSSCRPWALVNAVRELTADRLVSTEVLILKHSSSVLPKPSLNILAWRASFCSAAVISNIVTRGSRFSKFSFWRQKIVAAMNTQVQRIPILLWNNIRPQGTGTSAWHPSRTPTTTVVRLKRQKANANPTVVNNCSCSCDINLTEQHTREHLRFS